ncbi:MAG: hypothetical protein Q7Q71_06350 [Verrucomicrobiota bacterium JB023]|nr:hypothetical protein [Verrucomicrobiota bacterium JB023]
MSRNRKKSAGMSPFAIILLVMTALSLGCTEVFRVVVKNRQLRVAKEIEVVERRIKEHERDVTNLEIRLGQHANRFALRELLTTRGTGLLPIPQEAIIDIAPVSMDPLVARKE